MTAREYPVFTVTPKAERSLRAGHPWVYGEEVTAVEGAYQNGDMVDVVSNKGRYLGTGWVNDHSKIRVRIISRNANDTFDEAFFRRRVCYALNYRKTVMGPVDYRCCRLIFGEADQFPGLTVDRFENILVTQVLSLGMERRKDWVYRALVELLREDGEQIDAIYERNDVTIRTLEGLEQGKGFYQMEGLRTDLSGHVTITENGIKYDVDYIEGQKTGFFLDQKYNRQAAAKLARGRRVLDCFTHTGAFALNAAAAGAEHVTAVDVSAFALELAAENGKRNGLTNLDYKCADVFDLLTEMAKEKKCDYFIAAAGAGILGFAKQTEILMIGSAIMGMTSVLLITSAYAILGMYISPNQSSLAIAIATGVSNLGGFASAYYLNMLGIITGEKLFTPIYVLMGVYTLLATAFMVYDPLRKNS